MSKVMIELSPLKGSSRVSAMVTTSPGEKSMKKSLENSRDL